MIFVTHQLPVNVAGQPHLDRAAVWDGLATLDAMRRLAAQVTA